MLLFFRLEQIMDMLKKRAAVRAANKAGNVSGDGTGHGFVRRPRVGAKPGGADARSKGRALRGSVGGRRMQQQMPGAMLSQSDGFQTYLPVGCCAVDGWGAFVGVFYGAQGRGRGARKLHCRCFLWCIRMDGGLGKLHCCRPMGDS